MGLLGFMAAGAAQGAGAAGQAAFLELQKEQAEKDKIQFAAQVKADMDAKQRTQMVDDTNNAAKTIASSREQGLIDTAKKIYADNPVGLAAVDDAVSRGAYKQEPTAEDLLMARVQKGYSDPDKIIDNDRQKAKQISDDEKWRTQFEELTRHHQELEKKAAAELGLKKEERKDLSAAMDRYTESVKRFAIMAPGADEQGKAMLNSDIQATGSALLQYGIKVPAIAEERKGALKIMKGEIGEPDKLIHEDARGRVTQVDPSILPSYGTGAPGKVDPMSAQNDARRAVSTGKISKEEANARLIKAGISPI